MNSLGLGIGLTKENKPNEPPNGDLMLWDAVAADKFVVSTSDIGTGDGRLDIST